MSDKDCLFFWFQKSDKVYRQSLQTKFVCNFNKIIFYQVLSGALFSFFKNDLIEECYQKRSHVNEYRQRLQTKFTDKVCL